MDGWMGGYIRWDGKACLFDINSNSNNIIIIIIRNIKTSLINSISLLSPSPTHLHQKKKKNLQSPKMLPTTALTLSLLSALVASNPLPLPQTPPTGTVSLLIQLDFDDTATTRNVPFGTLASGRLLPPGANSRQHRTQHAHRQLCHRLPSLPRRRGPQSPRPDLRLDPPRRHHLPRPARAHRLRVLRRRGLGAGPWPTLLRAGPRACIRIRPLGPCPARLRQRGRRAGLHPR